MLGDAARDPKGWANRLEALAGSLRADLILPVSEVAMGTIQAFGVETRWPVACPERGAYEQAVDKHALLTRARRLGLEIPVSVLVEDPARTLGELPKPFTYPVILKPRRSRLLLHDRWMPTEVRLVRNDAELERAREADDLRGGVLVQEFVPGHGEGVFLLARAGRTLVRFAHRRLREKPPTGGQSVLCESIAPDPALLAGSERLLADLGWTGVAMIEFRRAPDGRALVMELNPRLWGSLQLAIDAGVDFPSLLVALHRGEPLPEVAPRVGVRTRWLLGDVDHLLAALRRPAVRAQIGKGVTRVLADFARSFADGSRLEILRRDDWRPFVRELAERWRG